MPAGPDVAVVPLESEYHNIETTALFGISVTVTGNVTVPAVPGTNDPACAPTLTSFGPTYIFTVINNGDILNPAGFIRRTVISSPSLALLFDTSNVRVVPVPLSSPIAMRAIVKSSADNVTGSALNVRVSTVVEALPLDPFAVKPIQVTGVKVRNVTVASSEST